MTKVLACCGIATGGTGRAAGAPIGSNLIGNAAPAASCRWCQSPRLADRSIASPPAEIACLAADRPSKCFPLYPDKRTPSWSPQTPGWGRFCCRSRISRRDSPSRRYFEAGSGSWLPLARLERRPPTRTRRHAYATHAPRFSGGGRAATRLVPGRTSVRQEPAIGAVATASLGQSPKGSSR